MQIIYYIEGSIKRKRPSAAKDKHLVGDLPSVVFQGELRQWHLWLGIQWVVTMVIVALLKECVVCCLAIIGVG